jgi:hypothetical protein
MMQDPGQIPPVNPFDPEGGMSVNPDGSSGGGLFGKTVTRGCRPSFSVAGDNSAWVSFVGIEAALILLMLIGILAVLFGNKERNEQAAQIVALAA